MNCKHKTIEGRTTKYFYCKAKGKAIDEYQCKDCMLRISDLPEGFEQLFQGFRR